MTKSLCLLLALSSAPSFATLNSAEEKTFSVLKLNPNAAPLTLGLPGIYKFENAAELLPKAEYVEGLKIVSPEPETLTFNAGEPVAVSFRSNGDALIQLLLSPEEVGNIPEAIVVDNGEFNKAGLKMVSIGNQKDLAEKYSADEPVQEARRGRGAFNRRGRMHYRNAAGGSYYGCVASVCKSIGGCMGTVGNGRGMTNYLRNKGWHPVADCKNPPIGAVASWSGGSHGAGHTGRWNGRGWCYDKGCGDPGKRYRFINCVAK